MSYTETEEIELKKSLSQLKEGIISLSAMLNKNNKAEVYFGINDEGKICGIELGKKTIADITHEIQNNLKPLPIQILITDFSEQNKKIIKIHAEGTDTPYSAYGKYYIRINDADIPMQSTQLQHFFENKEENYSKWELEETPYGIDEIDEDLLINYVRTTNDNGRLNYIYKNTKETLNKLGLLTENGNLNNAGYYLFSKNKPLTIKEANYPTDSRTEFGEIKEFRGNIFECISEAISYIQNHISYKSNIIGLQREEIPEIPIKAIREIVINSFAHCSYAKKGDFNQYAIFKSSVKIYNPGPILRDIDPLKFASGNIGSKIRNILIASTLFKYGYIDAFGTGFDRTFTLCSQNDVEYQYRNDEFGFTFIFERNVEFLSKKTEKNTNKRITSLDLNLIKLMKENKYITIAELSEKLGKSLPTIQRHLDTLNKQNKIQRMGSKKTGYWQVN